MAQFTPLTWRVWGADTVRLLRVSAAAKPSKVLKSKVSKSMALHIYRRAAAVAVCANDATFARRSLLVKAKRLSTFDLRLLPGAKELDRGNLL